MLNRRVIAAGLIITQLALSCSSNDRAASPPSTVANADVIEPVLNPDLRIGMVLNIAAPTAERDQQVSNVLMSAIRTNSAAGLAQLETIQIDEPDDVASAVEALRGLGVTIIVTTCDDGTVPDVISSGLANDMLVLTGCTTLPRPIIESTSDLVIDVASLATSSDAIALALDELLDDLPEEEGLEEEALEDEAVEAGPRVATLASDLIPDVAGECTNVEAAASSEVVVSERFTGLVDDPEVVVADLSEQLQEVDAIVLCALAPTVGEVVSALRANELGQPIVVPWFADDQTWSDDIDDVWIVAPSSRYGDDPIEEINSLYALLGDPVATDVITADTLTSLVDAVQRAGSVRPAQMAEVLRAEPFAALSGELTLNRLGNVERTYRLLEVVDGEPRFSTTLEP